MPSARTSDATGRRGDRVIAVGAAAFATALAWLGFASFPPMTVRVGTHATDVPVPVHYQVSVFPAFAAFVAPFAADLYRRRAPRTWAPRAALLVATGALAVVRLHGDVALSGHAVFLCAALAYELLVPLDPDAPLVAAAAIPGLLVTGWYKVAVWGDAGWFVASSLAGGAIGAVAAWWARRRGAR